MRKPIKPKEDTIASGKSQNEASSLDIAESLLKNNPRVLKPKKNLSSKNTQKQKSLKTLDQVSTSSEKDLKPYWNKRCSELSATLWLPHKIDSVEQHSHSSNGCLNYTEVLSQHWKKTIKPINSIQEPCLPSLLPSVPVTTANAQVIGSRKIRIYPENESNYFDLISLSRRAYNLTIEWINNQKKVDLKLQTEVRRNIREKVCGEWKDKSYASVVVDEAVNQAFDTFRSCVKKWSTKQKAKMRFRSRKDAIQSFVVQKLSSNGPYSRILGKVHVTEEIPEEAINKMATVTRRYGRWHLSVKKTITLCKSENQAHSVIALDPGVRTFISAFSPSEAIKFGDGYASTVIFPLLRKKDSLLGKRKRLLNKKSQDQWWQDQFRCVNKRIDRLSARIEDYLSDLHKRVAYDLVSNYETIICPPFETSQMVIKEGRKLRRSSVRQMQSLGHYKFQTYLKWMCRKYGKKFVSCSEAYTSKTRSWDGVINDKLGGSTTISDGVIVVDRDYNGARGIFLLAHTRQLTPCSDLNVTVETD